MSSAAIVIGTVKVKLNGYIWRILLLFAKGGNFCWPKFTSKIKKWRPHLQGKKLLSDTLCPIEWGNFTAWLMCVKTARWMTNHVEPDQMVVWSGIWSGSALFTQACLNL